MIALHSDCNGTSVDDVGAIEQSSRSRVIDEAIDYWLKADGTRELIDRHRLEGES